LRFDDAMLKISWLCFFCRHTVVLLYVPCMLPTNLTIVTFNRHVRTQQNNWHAMTSTVQPILS